MAGSPAATIVGERQGGQELPGARITGAPEVRVLVVGDEHASPAADNDGLLPAQDGNIVKYIPEVELPDRSLIGQGQARGPGEDEPDEQEQDQREIAGSVQVKGFSRRSAVLQLTR